MRSRHMICLLFLAGLGACGPVGVYYREGASVDAVSRAQTSCQSSALKQATVATQVRQRPPTYIPGRLYCDPTGCVRGPGYWADGGFYTVDTNEGLRNQITTQCMADKGYSRIELQRCSGGAVSFPDRMPSLAGPTCAQKDASGTWRVATK